MKPTPYLNDISKMQDEYLDLKKALDTLFADKVCILIIENDNGNLDVLSKGVPDIVAFLEFILENRRGY